VGRVYAQGVDWETWKNSIKTIFAFVLFGVVVLFL